MRFLIGLAVAVFFMCFGFYIEGGHLVMLLQFSAFLIVVGGAAGAMIIAYPWKVIRESLSALKGTAANGAIYADAARVFRAFGNLCILSSLVGLVFAGIHVASNVEDGSRIGPGIAVSLVAPLYGLLIKLLVSVPLHDRCVAMSERSRS